MTPIAGCDPAQALHHFGWRSRRRSGLGDLLIGLMLWRQHAQQRLFF